MSTILANGPVLTAPCDATANDKNAMAAIRSHPENDNPIMKAPWTIQPKNMEQVIMKIQ